MLGTQRALIVPWSREKVKKSGLHFVPSHHGAKLAGANLMVLLFLIYDNI